MSLKGKKGVDISAANGKISLAKVKSAGYDFVMIKCGIGNDTTNQDDSLFEYNIKQAEALGMPWGVYFYTYSLSAKEDESELRHILRLLKGKKPTMPVAIDVEDDGYKKRNGGWNYANVNRNAKYLLEGLVKNGYYPMLYTGFEEIENLISPDVWKKYDMWFAQWNTQCQYPGDNLGMWQYGGETNYLESNSISGVGVIDKDKCYKDYPTIIKNGGYNGWKKGSGGSDSRETGSAVKIKSDSKLRSKAFCGGGSAILATLKKGTAVTHIKDDGCGWSKIKADGKTGWVQNTRLNKPGLSAYPTMTPGVAVYEKPDCTSRVLGTLKPFAPVTVRYIVEAGTGKGWAEVAFPDSKGVGFVNADNLY